MSEIYTVSAKTVDEAIELATKLYGGDDREISHEIISLPKKGFLGIGAKDAEIRVTVSDGSEDELGSIVKEIKNYKKQTSPERGYYADDNRDAKRGSGKQTSGQGGQQKKSRGANEGRRDRQEQPSPKEKEQQTYESAQKSPRSRNEEQTASGDAAQNDKGRRDGKTQQNSRRRGQTSSQPRSQRESSAKTGGQPVPAEAPRRSAASAEELSFAADFVNLMIRNMNLEAAAAPKSAPAGDEFVCTPEANLYPEIEVEGRDTGVLIGHHGETLDAIQYLVNLALLRRSGASRGEREHLKITVDIENYRAKREETLRALARRMAARAVKYKRNVFLEPMNPYERRIIHSELQDYPDVSTHSVGSDTSRKIIITYEGEDRAPQNNRRRSRGDRGRARSERKSAGEEEILRTEEAAETVTEAADMLPPLPTEEDIPLPTLDDADVRQDGEQ